MNEELIRNFKVGTILNDPQTNNMQVVIGKSNNRINTFDYYSGRIASYTIDVIIANDIKPINIKNMMSMDINIHPDASTAAKFINGAIILYNNNPVFYKRIMESVDPNNSMAYISDKTIDENRVVINKQTKKSYTIAEIRNISNDLYYILFRNGMILGQVMEYERLCVSQKDFNELYEFEKDKEFISEKIELFTDEEVKDIIKIQEVKKVNKPKKKMFTNFDKDKPVIKINSIKCLDEFMHDGEYLDLFSGGLYRGAKFRLKNIMNKNIIFEVENIINHNVYGKIINEDLGVVLRDAFKIEDELLYKSLSTINYEDNNRTFLDVDINKKIKKDGKAFDIKLNKECSIEEIDDKSLNLSYNEIGLAINRYVQNVDFTNDRLDVGTVFTYKNRVTFIVYKCNNQSINCYVNFFDLKKPNIRINISHDLINDNNNCFLICNELSLYELCNL